MKSKILTLLLGLAIVGFAPLTAQMPDEVTPEDQIPVTEEQPAAEVPPLEQQDPTATETEELELQSDEESAASEELPATASPLPLIALLGAAGVASAAWVRRGRK